MNDQKFIAGSVCGEWDEYAYPCYHRNQNWNGWAMPYFTFKEAKKVAKEMKGRYDKEKDAFIFNMDGEDDVYEPMNIKVRGCNAKVYATGAGYWCWDLTSDMKIFSVYWSNDFFESGTKKVVQFFFSEERCYTKEDIAAINDLAVGATLRSPDYGSGNTVTRIA